MQQIIEQAKSLLYPPVFADEDKTRAARLLHIVLLTIIVATSFYYVVTYLNQFERLHRFPVMLAVIVIALAMLIFMRRGPVEQIARLFLTLFWLLLTYAAYVTGGIGSPAFYTYVVVVMVAGLTLGWRSAVFFGFLCALGSSIIYYLEVQDQLPAFTPYSLSLTLIFNVAFFFVSAAIISLTVQDTKRAMRRLRTSQDTLTEINRVYRTLSDCNQVLVHATNEEELLDAICQAIVNTGGYRMAWVGFAQDDAKHSIKVVAHAGQENGYLTLHPLSWAEGTPVPTLATFAINTGELQSFESIADLSENFTARHNLAKQLGYRAGISLPLKAGDVAFGALGIYASDSDSFSEEELRLMIELAGDIAFGITTLRTNVERLRAEARFQSIFQASPMGTFITSLHADRPVEVNTIILEMIGYSYEEILADFDLIQDHVWVDHNERRRILGAAAEEGSVMNAEVQWRQKSGNIRSMLMSLERIELNDEPHLLGMVVDITERKQAENRIHYLANLLENVSDAVISTDGQRKIVSWNAAAEAIYGWTAQEAIGQQISELLKTTFKGETRENALQIVRDKGAWVGEVTQFRKDGNPVIIRSSVTLLKATQGMVAVNRDITAIKEAEERAHKLQERMQAVIEYMELVLFSIDREGIITLFEGKQLTTLGSPPGDVVGQSIYERYRKLPGLLAAIEKALRGEANTWFGTVGERYYETRVIPVLDPEGVPDGVIGLSIDITERFLIEEELVKAQRLQIEVEKEREVIKLKEDFIGVVSHQFRTPLTVILSSNELMERYYDRLDDARRHKYLGQIREQVRYMTDLIDDMLLITQARAGRLEFSPAPLDVESFCRTMLEQWQFSDDNQHEITFTAEGDFENLLMDVTLLRHIMGNLLSNAVKYTPEGKTIHSELSQEDKQVVIIVKDQGIGIPLKDQEYLFQPFHRAANAREKRGTGLGLAIVLDSVKAHGGTIDVDTEENVGTTFTVRLPLKR